MLQPECDVLAVAQQRLARQQGFQYLLALKQLLLTDVLAAHEQGVEDDVQQPLLLPQSILQELEP